MENDNHKIYCQKCGAEMNSNSRYCMNCGALNYDHEANKNMQQFIPKYKNNTYQIGSGQFMIQNDNNQISQSIATNTGNKFICFFINYFLYWLILLVSFFSIKEGYELKIIMESSFPLVTIFTSIFFFYIYTFELLFMKCNKKWWASLIPIYNMMEFSDIVFHKKWIGLLTFIPLLGQVFLLFMLYKLGEKFKYNGILLVLLPFISIPIISFGVYAYEGYIFTNKEDKKALEKEYRQKKVFLTTVITLFIISLSMIVYMNLRGNEENPSIISNHYYSYEAKMLASKVKQKMAQEQVVCEEGYSTTTGIYYFKYSDINEIIFVPFHSLQEIIEGYVKVENTMEGSKYYVSINNGKRGLPETEDIYISAEKIIESSEMISLESNVNICHFLN